MKIGETNRHGWLSRNDVELAPWPWQIYRRCCSLAEFARSYCMAWQGADSDADLAPSWRPAVLMLAMLCYMLSCRCVCNSATCAEAAISCMTWRGGALRVPCWRCAGPAVLACCAHVLSCRCVCTEAASSCMTWRGGVTLCRVKGAVL